VTTEDQGSQVEADEVEADEVEDLDLDDQADLAKEFVIGLLVAMNVQADVEVKTDDDSIEVLVTGTDLGTLIGPKAATLYAIQELVRTAVQRHTDARVARISLDVAGYRQKRREALTRFATQVAEQVIETGEERALEPMNASDRKIIHDTVNDVDGVTTESRGEEPTRWVVIRPA
jgi:spoIIIJ-associated protein